MSRLLVQVKPLTLLYDGRMSDAALLDRIVVNPDVAGGRATIRGHRIWVSLILGQLPNRCTPFVKAIVGSVLSAAAASLVGCAPQQAVSPVQTLSAAHTLVLTEGKSARLTDGVYDFALSPCRGANTFLLTGRLALSKSRSTTNFSTDPSGRGEHGQQWIQAGIYSGALWNDTVAPCEGKCIPIVTSAQQINGCGWSLRLHLNRAGPP